ncbi:TPA: hypothetical protein ACJT8N_002055 [Legionella pneumophila]|nr:hypothetical protein [Legionella pneumophila]
MKINKINLEGMRGIKNNVDLPLNGRSILLYGDNGSGKSTIADSLEWFFYDKVNHLSSEEIGRKGIDALRNIFLNNEQKSSVEILFSNLKLNNEKSIEEKNNSSNTNNSDEFQKYLNETSQENLILRYRDLLSFILGSKTDKLNALSGIIGYSKIIKVRDIFRSTSNKLSREIKSKDFDKQINYQQQQIIEQISQNITSDKQFYQCVQSLVKTILPDIKIEKAEDIESIIGQLRDTEDNNDLKHELFLQHIKEKFILLPANIDELERTYFNYKRNFDNVISDIQKLKSLKIEKLLNAAKELLSETSMDANSCPLCLQQKDLKELLVDIKHRLSTLEEIKSEQQELKESKEDLNTQINSVKAVLNSLTSNSEINLEQNSVIKKAVFEILSEVTEYEKQLKCEVSNGIFLVSDKELIINRNTIELVEKICEEKIKEIHEKRSKRSRIEIYGKVSMAWNAYKQLLNLQKEQRAYQVQYESLVTTYKLFMEKQKKSLETFLNAFSEKIDNIYRFLNPGENVNNIKLVPIIKNEELTGITIELDFFEVKNISPPNKYLSESHLNCLGIAFFLSSVEALNKKNQFFVLDDVVSSFDSNHRKRFADLIVENYPDYQIILSTHEKIWFDIIKNLVQQKNWIIKSIKFNDEKGSYIEDSPQTIREKIQNKIKNRDEDKLGNLIREYLEYLLKDIAKNLEVKVVYKSNEMNEDRMAFELLTELKGTLKKRKCLGIENNPVIARLMSSIFIGNKDSHDSSVKPVFSDMKAFWVDVEEFEKLFYCNVCNSPISSKNYDSVNKKIRCKKGELTYDWTL